MNKFLSTITAFAGVTLIAASAHSQDGPGDGIDPAGYCKYRSEERLSLTVDAVRSAWYDLDVHGRATIGGMNPHSATFGLSPLAERDPMRARMEQYKLRLQRLMVLTGVLFPHYNRSSDGDRLLGRFVTRSVPIYGTAPEHQIAVMEAFLSRDDANRDRGIAFIEALHALEGSALALSIGKTAPEFHDHNLALQRSFDDFMPALKSALFSPAFETALDRRLSNYCSDEFAEQEREQEL